MVLNLRRSSIVIGLGGNLLIVRIGPFKATGSSTTLTLAPSFNLASTIGLASFTTLLQSEVICQITFFNFSLESNFSSSLMSFPFFSIKIPSVPLTIISVISSSSKRSCNRPNCLMLWNISCLILSLSNISIIWVLLSRLKRFSISLRISSSVRLTERSIPSISFSAILFISCPLKSVYIVYKMVFDI